MNVTRGNGALERFLADQRAKLVDTLIPDASRSGRILDIGCGSFPYFLTSTRFHEKHGLDKVIDADTRRYQGEDILIKNHDMETGERLPYTDGYFDIVTMLAVFEHIEPTRLVGTLREVHRVLKPGGSYILTTPAAWTDRLLRIMARLRLVSKEEIEEHKDTYSHRKIIRLLKAAGFSDGKIQCGYFEAYMNLWLKAGR